MPDTKWTREQLEAMDDWQLGSVVEKLVGTDAPNNWPPTYWLTGDGMLALMQGIAARGWRVEVRLASGKNKSVYAAAIVNRKPRARKEPREFVKVQYDATPSAPRALAIAFVLAMQEMQS